METERFEALIDAILAIIITLIVMEIPLPKTTTIYSLLELAPDFLAYALSFVICFNVWNYHHNLFNIVKKLNSSVTFASGITIMFIGLLPHVTTMISTDFNSFTAHAMFGLIFLITALSSFVVDQLLLRIDKANIALRLALANRKKITVLTVIIFIFAYILGYYIYPPIIMIACVSTVIINYVHKNILRRIKLPF